MPNARKSTAVALVAGALMVVLARVSFVWCADGCEAPAPSAGSAPATALPASRAPGAPLTTLALLAGMPGGRGHRDDWRTNARFSQPVGLTFDGAGHLFVSDLDDTIREIDLATGEVTTLAGGVDQPGLLDGIGAGARFNEPRGLAADRAGNLYVADCDNGAIRRVVIGTGATTTVARKLDSPSGLALDGGGHLFIAEEETGTILQLTLATGALTTVASHLQRPTALAWEGPGRLLVAEASGQVIDELALGSGRVTVFSGLPGACGDSDGLRSTARLCVPSGLALDDAGHLFVADPAFRSIREVDVTTGTVTTVAKLPRVARHASISDVVERSPFQRPIGVALDGTGHLFVADSETGTIWRIWGGGSARTRTVDAFEPLVRGDLRETWRRIQHLRFGTRPRTVTAYAGAEAMPGSSNGVGIEARFAAPHGVVVDRTGTLYVADAGNARIRRIILSTGAVSTIRGPSLGLAGAKALAFDGADHLFVAGSIYLQTLDLATGSTTLLAGEAPVFPLLELMDTTRHGSPRRGEVGSPGGLALDSRGQLFVSNVTDGSILRVDSGTGSITNVAGPRLDDPRSRWSGASDGIGEHASFNGPQGLALDGAGNLYVADTGNGTIRKIVPAFRMVSTLAGSLLRAGHVDGVGLGASFEHPSALAYDGVGALYVGDGETVRKIDLATWRVTTVVGVAGQRGVAPGRLPAGLNHVGGLAVGPNGTLYVSDDVENVVLEVR